MIFRSNISVKVGALGKIDLKKGCYCYVGSAMNGLDQRLERHFAKQKAMRWHVDYLSVLCDDIFAYESTGKFIPECKLCTVLQDAGATPAVKGFGCSDCDCLTHLYRVEKKAAEQALIVKNLTKFVK